MEIEFDKILKRQKLVQREALSVLDNVLEYLSMDSKVSLEKVKEDVSKTIDSHKDLMSNISKTQKNFDKKFKIDLNSIWTPGTICKESLPLAISSHFIREGHFDLAAMLEDEAGIMSNEEVKLQFSEMFNIQDKLRVGDVSDALNWAKTHSEKLQKLDSGLEFELIRFKFIQILSTGNVQKCLEFAKLNFKRFSKRFISDIQKLMCSILFIKNIKESPYSDFTAPHFLMDIQSIFARDFCSLLGLSPLAPLLVSTKVGTTALPTIFKMSSILKSGMNMDWQSRGELPVEIPLLDSQRYHSIFTCPVSKEQATLDNPPMRLVCGHVILKEPLNRLAKGNANAKFKCPYCPQDSTMSQCQRLYF